MFNTWSNWQVLSSSSSSSLSLLPHSPSQPVTRRGQTPSWPSCYIHTDHVVPSRTGLLPSSWVKACLTCDPSLPPSSQFPVTQLSAPETRSLSSPMCCCGPSSGQDFKNEDKCHLHGEAFAAHTPVPWISLPALFFLVKPNGPCH